MVIQGNLQGKYQLLISFRRMPAGVGEVLLERDESVIPDQARKLCCWKEHFKELFNHAAPPNTATVTGFVYFASAFDSVDRDSLWRISVVDGMPRRRTARRPR